MAKNIIICCDGTGNQYGKHNTNVVKLYELLSVGPTQSIFYDPGVGTTAHNLFMPLQKIFNLISQAFGSDLQGNVEDVYYFLMNTYQENDKIFLFGFSRGAHTVRRLSTMLEMCGLLHRGSENMIPYVSKMYLSKKGNQEQNDKDQELQGFKKAFSRKCPIFFVGIWDTVSALSNLLPRPKIDGILSREQTFGYHAISIDEKRLQFPPSLWKEDKKNPAQTIEQIWFTGVHSDIGGSYPESGLSDITLKWMLNKAVAQGLQLKPHAVNSIGNSSPEQIHKSWIGIWWFVPSHIYFLLFISIIITYEFFVSIFNFSWWPILKLIDNLYSFSIEYYCSMTLIFILMIFTTNKMRRIPHDALIHKSVQDQMNKNSKYQPKNLMKVIKTIKWVE